MGLKSLKIAASRDCVYDASKPSYVLQDRSFFHGLRPSLHLVVYCIVQYFCGIKQSYLLYSCTAEVRTFTASNPTYMPLHYYGTFNLATCNYTTGVLSWLQTLQHVIHYTTMVLSWPQALLHIITLQ